MASLVRAILKPDSQIWPYEDSQSANDISLLYTELPHHVRPAGEDAFEYVDGAGILDVKWRHGSQTLAADARHVKYTGPAHLCNACLSALGYLAQNLKQCIDHENAKNFKSKKAVVHHQNLMALFAAANGGCHLCKIIWGRRFKTNGMATTESIRTEFCWNSTDPAPWGGQDPGDARLICNIVSTTAQNHNQHTWQTIFRFQCWPSPAFDHFFLPQSTALRWPAERGNTRASRHLACQWMQECKANVDGKHSQCQIRTASWYPTRLLDLSTIEDTGSAFLVVTDLLEPASLAGQEYITLSHCWGAWGAKELPVLNEANINDRVDHGMPFSELPATFRDAIQVALWFNVRWLWIDSLCIIQDSRDDWRREARTMCDVYQNALLNISADHAVDAREGCFHDRYFATVESFKLRLEPLQSEWWFSIDERNLFEWVKDAPSSERAWIYQERHLARRVLHFTEHEVFWECRAEAPSFRSETFPHGSPLLRDYLGQTKLQLNDSSTISVTNDPHLRRTWNDACRDFSRRKLTFQTDKLPALSGLARNFGSRCAQDTYIAGMWASQLPHALFWNVPQRGRPDQPTYVADSGAPSWSWLSCSHAIEPSKVEEDFFVAEIAAIVTAFQLKTSDPYGEVSSAALSVFGNIRHITSVMKQIVNDPASDAYRGLRQVDKPSRYRNLYVDGNLNRDIGYGPIDLPQWGEMPDWFHGFEPVNYICLFLAVTQKGPRDDLVLRGLLLEPTEQGTFHRVGHIFCRGQCALKMRYRYVGGGDEKEEDEAWKQLWKLVSPFWGEVEQDHLDRRDATGPKVFVRPKTNGPSAVYEFDGDIAEDVGFERLLPELITIV